MMEDPGSLDRACSFETQVHSSVFFRDPGSLERVLSRPRFTRACSFETQVHSSVFFRYLGSLKRVLPEVECIHPVIRIAETRSALLLFLLLQLALPHLPELPQSADDFRRGYVIGVVRDQPHQKRPVLFEIGPGERLDFLALGPRPYLTSEQEVVADELDLVGHEHGPDRPNEETGDADEGDEGHPEPEEEVDLLVVEVDRQDALDRVSLRVGQILAADLEVAERDAWKGDVAVLRPVVFERHLVEDVDAEGVVLGVQDVVQQVQLEEDVGDVDELGEQEQ